MLQVSNTSFTTSVSSNAMAVVDYLSKSMMSALPFIVCAALFRTVAVIMGEGMLGLWSADSDIYRLFYSWLYNAGYYFLPIYLGWAAARQLGCSEQLGMMLGGVLIAPDLLKLVDAASTMGASMTSVYGLLPAPVNDYTATVIPILISVPVLWRVECFFRRVIPKAVAFSFVPFATMLVMVPVSLCITRRRAAIWACCWDSLCLCLAIPVASCRCLRSWGLPRVGSSLRLRASATLSYRSPMRSL